MLGDTVCDKGSHKNWKFIDILTEFGNQRGYTAGQVALAWLMVQKPWIVPIPGTTKIAHLYENCAVANIEFSKDELQKLYENKIALGNNFSTTNRYHSSSEAVRFQGDTWAAWQIFFGDGSWAEWDKLNQFNVRAVRSF